MNHNGEPLLSKSYHIPLSLFDKAFRAYQKKYVYPRNIVMSCVFGGIAAVYAIAAFKDPENTLAYILIVVCVAMILNMWYNPMKVRRNLMESLKELENDIYHFSLFENCATISTEDTPKPVESVETDADAQETEISAEPIPETDSDGFNQLFEETESAEPIPETELPFDLSLKIHEFDDFFMFYLIKRNFYVVPKAEFSEDELKLLRDTAPVE